MRVWPSPSPPSKARNSSNAPSKSPPWILFAFRPRGLPNLTDSVKIRLLPLIAICLVATLFLAIGFVLGLRHGQFQSALEEAKVARATLRRDDIIVQPQLREFLKGRIYYLIGTKFYDSGYLGTEWDVGTVDTNILVKPIYAKDSTFAPRTYAESIAEPAP